MTLNQIVGGMSRRGHDMCVVAPRQKDRQTHAFGFPVIEVPGLPIPRYDGLRFGLPAYRRLRALWQQDRPDTVHVATEGPLGWSAVRAAEAEGIPLVSSFHTNFHQYGSHYGFACLRRAVLVWLRHLHNRTQATFTPAAGVLDELRESGFHNLRLMGRGVDTEQFGPFQHDPALRETWGVPADAPIALYVGRVAPEKNIDLSIRAYRAMKQHLPQLRMVIVGDGPSRQKLEAANSDLIFAGMRHGEDLARHYASANCFLFASITETFGNVVTEAMASGLPVLAYDYAAPAAYIKNGVNGFTAPLNNPDAYIETARLMATRRPEWSQIGKAAVATIRPISWDAIITQYGETLQAVDTP